MKENIYIARTGVGGYSIGLSRKICYLSISDEGSFQLIFYSKESRLQDATQYIGPKQT